MIKKSIFIILNILLLVSTTTFFSITNFNNMNVYLKITLILIPQILFVLSVIFKWNKLITLHKLFITIFILYCVIVLIYTILFRCGVLNKFSSVKYLKEYILSTGGRGVLTYIIIQILQVIFLPIPASIICIVGSLIYGPFWGALYCSIGVLIGSFISYFIGKIFGYRLVTWIVGKQNTDKYSEIIRSRGMFFLGLAFLLPMFPDDILCFIAGITNLSTNKFLLITLITRPIGVICMAIFGSGHLIPFTGWGIYAWFGILVVAVALVFVIFRWQEQIQNFIMDKLFKKNKNKSINKFN